MKKTAIAVVTGLGVLLGTVQAQRGFGGRAGFPAGGFRSGGTTTYQNNGRQIVTGATSFIQGPQITGFISHGPVTSITSDRTSGRGGNGDRRFSRRNRNGNDFGNSGNVNSGYAAAPDVYWAGGYGNQSAGYIGPRRSDGPNAYTGWLGYAGAHGYAAPDGYAGPYGYPFDNAVWWDQRFHHPYRPYGR